MKAAELVESRVIGETSRLRSESHFAGCTGVSTGCYINCRKVPRDRRSKEPFKVGLAALIQQEFDVSPYRSIEWLRSDASRILKISSPSTRAI